MIPEFAPPVWLRGPHGQTIFPAYAPFRVRHHPSQSRLLRLPDGDCLVIHDDVVAEQSQQSEIQHVALLLHGLTGSASSPYVVRTAAKLREQGFHIVRIDLRGHGEGQELSRLPGHAGRSEDVAHALRDLTTQYPRADFFLMGVSLSGNIIVKMMGELGMANDPLNERLRAAVAVSAPIDLVTSAAHLLGPQGRLYNRVFVKRLMKMLAERIANKTMTCELPAQWPQSLWEFDDVVTAPLSGFSGADDYYNRCSACRVIEGVKTPTLLLSAADDPIVPASIYRAEPSPAGWPACVVPHLTEHGGHVGFYAGRTADRDRYWMDWRVVDWFQHHRNS